MRIFVTGSSGQLGQEVIRLLDSTHHEVYAASRSANGFDLANRDSVLGAITTFAPELILHCGAMTHVDACETSETIAFATNSMGTRWVADAARISGAHVVYVSTDYVFDGNQTTPYVEWDLTNPLSVYGKSKLLGEHALDPSWTIARTSWVCSATSKNMVRTVLSLAEKNTPMTFVNDQRGNPTFVSDLAPCLVALGVGRHSGTFHLTNTGSVSWFEFVQAVLQAAGYSPDMVSPISTAELDPPRDAPRPTNSVLANVAWLASGFDALPDFRDTLSRVVAELQEDR